MTFIGLLLNYHERTLQEADACNLPHAFKATYRRSALVERKRTGCRVETLRRL